MICSRCMGLLVYGYLTSDAGFESRVVYCTECSHIEHVGAMVNIDKTVLKARSLEHQALVLKGGD